MRERRASRDRATTTAGLARERAGVLSVRFGVTLVHFQQAEREQRWWRRESEVASHL